jgi:hypothetical protein
MGLAWNERRSTLFPEDSNTEVKGHDGIRRYRHATIATNPFLWGIYKTLITTG